MHTYVITYNQQQKTRKQEEDMAKYKYCVTNDDLNDWKEYLFTTASAAAEFINSGRIGDNFTIWWNTPVTGEARVLLHIRRGKTAVKSDVYRLPKVFERIAKRCGTEAVTLIDSLTVGIEEKYGVKPMFTYGKKKSK